MRDKQEIDVEKYEYNGESEVVERVEKDGLMTNCDDETKFKSEDSAISEEGGNAVREFKNRKLAELINNFEGAESESETKGLALSDWKLYRSESECGQPKCNKCGKLYSNVKNLKCHARNVHISKKEKPKKKKLRAALSEESPGKILEATVTERICLICKKIFGKKSEMKKHLVRHTNIFKHLNVDEKMLRAEDSTSATCKDCGKWDARANNIKNHIALVHYQLHNTINFSNMESYDLSEGGTALKGDGTVRRRERLIQTFLCQFCEKVFYDFNKSSLNKHIRFVHEGIRRKKKEDTWLKKDGNFKGENI